MREQPSWCCPGIVGQRYLFSAQCYRKGLEYKKGTNNVPSSRSNTLYQATSLLDNTLQFFDQPPQKIVPLLPETTLGNIDPGQVRRVGRRQGAT